MAEVLHELDPISLPLFAATEMMREHNNFVVQLVQLRNGKKFEVYIKTYDQYYAHILGLVDTLYYALVNY